MVVLIFNIKSMSLKKFTINDLNLKMEGLKGEEKAFMENIGGLMIETINKALEGALSKEDVETQFKGINDKLKAYDAEKFEQMVKDNEALVEQVKNLGDTIEKLKQSGVSMNTVNKLDEKINEMFESEKFIEFAEGRRSKSGKFDFSMKDVVSLTGNYEGNILISQQQRRVVDPYANGKTHLREVILTETGDPEYPSLTYNQISSLDRNVRFVTENGQLPESSFSVKEKTTQTRRLGTTIFISKRMLKTKVWLRSYLLNRLSNWVLMAEDWNIMFGDGAGENLEGIVNTTGVDSIENILSTDICTGTAGSIVSVKSAHNDKDTIIEFKDAQPNIRTGMQITCTGATVLTDLNSPQSIVKMNDREILLVGVAYKNETSVASMTFKVTNKFFKNIEEPNSEDAIRTGFAVMNYAEYSPNAVVLNPSDVNAMESEKDTTGRSLNLVKVVNGRKVIANRTIVESSQIPEGDYLIGDFINGLSLIDYSALTFEWAEDVDTKRKNQVALIIQEEVILAVYNPFAFAYGSLEALKTAITKA